MMPGEDRRRERRRTRAAGALTFLLALVLRVLFWQSTPDATAPYTPFYKGDATIWLTYARAIQDSEPFELGLPLRPPGMAYLVALLWNGEPGGVSTLRLIWCLLGAGVAVVIYAAALRSFGFRAALITGLCCACSSALMLLSTSLNNETPYLLLVALIFYTWEPLRHRAGTAILAMSAALNAAACLVRVEHVLFAALLSAYLVPAWAMRDGTAAGWKSALGRLGWWLFVFTLVILPWHRHAWSQIRRFNTEPLPVPAATEQAHQHLEHLLRGLSWQPGASEARNELPAFSRRTAGNFVAATVALRGGGQITRADFEILDDAFGSQPRALASHPFVALYGGLNFSLANNPRATGGFGRAPLERPPLLRGGPERYAGILVDGLPPLQLTLTYPPHLEIVNHGYRQGWRWIRTDPLGYLGLAWKKLGIFWQGGAMGLTGYNWPLGLSGTRRAVDLVVADAGAGPFLWRSAMLLLVGFGLWGGRGREALVPWVAFLLSNIVVTVAFFGYARIGATVTPVLALLIALAVERAAAAAKRTPVLSRSSAEAWLRTALVLAVLLGAVEARRWYGRPQVTLDGKHVGGTDPFPEMDYRDRRLVVQ